MKIVIDISNEMFSDISKGYICQEYADELINLVKNGTPLNKIRAEATSLKISYTDHDKDTYRRGVNDVLRIIDKCNVESEVKHERIHH